MNKKCAEQFYPSGNDEMMKEESAKVAPVAPAVAKEQDCDCPCEICDPSTGKHCGEGPCDVMPAVGAQPAKFEGEDWAYAASRAIVAEITESLTFTIDYTSDDWRNKIAAIIAEYVASLSQPLDRDVFVGFLQDQVKHLQSRLERVTRERKWVDAEHMRIGVVRTVGVASFDDLMTTPFLFNRRAEAAERSLETAREALKGIRNLADPKTSILRIPDNALKQIQLIAESALSGEGKNENN
jgi:hypothetical protein